MNTYAYRVMEDSDVGPEGMEALAEALARNPQSAPKCIQIGHGNNIGPQGMTALARVLMTKPEPEETSSTSGFGSPSRPRNVGGLSSLKRLS